MENPPCHRHDGSSPLPLGMDACPPPARWTGKDTVWPHDPRSGWSYCAVVAAWTILSATRGPASVDANGTIFYRVQVAIQSPTAVSYMRGLLRRFSDFLKLHAALRKAFPKKRIPPPPPKNPLQRMNSNPALLEERRRALDEWMQQLLMDIDYSRSVPMAGFLELEAAARGAASALSQDDSPSSSLPSNLPTPHDTATVSTAPRRSPSSTTPTAPRRSPSSTPPTVSSESQSSASNTTSLHHSSHADFSSHLADSSMPSRPPSRSASEAAPVVGPTARPVWTVANELGTSADVTRAISQLDEANLRSGGREGTNIMPSGREVTDGEVNALLEAEFGIQKGVAEGGANVRVSGRDAEGVAKESSPEGGALGILKNGWHRRTGSGGSENSDTSSFSAIGSEPSEISTSASLFGGDMSALLAERERQQEAEAAVAIDGVGLRIADNKATGGMGGGKAGASSAGDVLRSVGMILPMDHRTIVQRMLTVMQRRLTTAKADVEELLARLKQETAIKEFLMSKVRDLEGELDDTRSKSREALLQVHMAEREKLTELQWALEEARFELHKEKEERRKDKEQIEASEKRAQDAERAQEEVLQEMEALGAQLEASKREREEIDAKAKMEKRVLIKEVKSLRHVHVVLKDEAEAALSAREEAEKKLRDLEEQVATNALQREKLVHEVGVLRQRLKDCGELVKLDGEGTVLDPSSDLVDVLSVSDQRIECILAETQLLREQQMNGTHSQADVPTGSSGGAVDNDQHADIIGQEMDNGQAGTASARTRTVGGGSKAGLPQSSLSAVFADILSDNAHLRKVVNSLTRGAALSAQKT